MLEIAKIIRKHHLCRSSLKILDDYNTVEDYLINVSRIKREVIKICFSNSWTFRHHGSEKSLKSTKSWILKLMSKHASLITRTSSKDIHKENWVKWATEYMKTYFSTILFNDECFDTLNEPYRWSDGWRLLLETFLTRWDVNKPLVVQCLG